MAGEWLPAVSGLVGTVIGGCITYFGQKLSRDAEKKAERAALAGGIAAEIEAYLLLMQVRNHAAGARALAARIRGGSGEKLRGFLHEDNKPLDEFPVARAHMGDVGQLGDVCFDLAKFYALLAGVQTTVISAERGKYDSMSASDLADMIERETVLWEQSLALATSVLPRVKAIVSRG